MSNRDEDAKPVRYEPLEGFVADDGRVVLANGRVLDISQAPRPATAGVRGSVIGPVSRRVFSTCPICLAAPATSREHVPPQAVGGRWMTKTCSRCNNEFGRLEAVIADSYAGVLSATRFAGGDVPGSRHGGKVRIRNLPDGSFVLVVDGRHSDPALPHIFRGGTFSLTADEPDDDRLRIALLKNAYLAACLVLGTIPDSDDAAALRSELLAAINASTPAAGRFAASLVKLRLYDEPPHPLYRARVHRDDTVTYGFGLGKFGFVSWPIPDLLEAARPFYSCNPQLGQP